MFQTEIKFITDFTLNHVKKLGAFFTFERLFETNIHPAIKQYLNAEFEFLIYEDRQKLIQGSLFDYSGSKINHHFSMIAEEIKKTKKVSYEDMKLLISRSVSFNISYILKPNWSLQKLIFGEKKSISVVELELVLNYLYFYDYLKNVFKSYLSKRNIVNLSSTEFELILNKIDRELFSTHFEKLVDNSLVSIADLFSIGGLNKKNISVEAVEIFLKEKNLIDHLLKLKRVIPNPGKRKYDIDDIRRIIYSATPVEPESINPASEEPESEVDGDFEKVKTLEEAEIKPLTQTEEFLEEEQKSDENIIQELVEDEIVKKDIEELIQEKETDEEILEEEPVWEKEIIIDKEPEAVQTDDKKKSTDLTDELNEEVISPEVEGMVISSFLDDPDKKAEEKTAAKTVEDMSQKTDQEKPIEEEEMLEALSEDENDVIEDPELLSEKDEQELFSFYEEELKDFDTVAPDDEEVLNIEDIETKEKEDLPKEIEQSEKVGETVNFDELEIEDEEYVDEQIEEPKTEEVPEPPITEKIEIEKVDLIKPEIQEKKETVEESIKEESPKVAKKKPRDVFSYLSSKEIDKITDSIFNSDSEDFANTIEKISECEDYQKATEILKALFISIKISPQSKQAVILTNAVANYFDQV